MEKFRLGSLLTFSIFSSLVGFGSRPTYILYQYISPFRQCNISVQYIILLSFQFVSCWSFVFGDELWNFKKRRWRNLTETPRIIFMIQDCWSAPSSMFHTSLQTEEVFTVKEYKHTHTRTKQHRRNIRRLVKVVHHRKNANNANKALI